MPTFEFRCGNGHVTDDLYPMGRVPTVVSCPTCGQAACRLYGPPAAIHFKGPGFYTTDVKGRMGRKRRRNVGDDLPKEFDSAAAKIADAI